MAQFLQQIEFSFGPVEGALAAFVVLLAKPVKAAGSHVASIKLHPAVTARVPFEVVAK